MPSERRSWIPPAVIRQLRPMLVAELVSSLNAETPEELAAGFVRTFLAELPEELHDRATAVIELAGFQLREEMNRQERAAGLPGPGFNLEVRS